MNSRIFPTQGMTALGARRLAVPTDPDSVDLRALLRGFWRRKWAILAAMLLAGVATWLVVDRIPPVYSASAKVMLDPRKAQIVTTGEVVGDLTPSEQIVNGEVAVLRSNLLLGDVVDRLGPDRLAAIDPALAPPSISDRLRSVLGLTGGKTATPPDPAARRERLIRAAAQALTIYGESNSYVITIRAETGDPLLSSALANTVAERYIAQQLDARRAAVGQATEWLEQRLAALKSQVETAEAAVAGYRARSLVQDGGTLENVSQQLSDLNTQLVSAQAARVEAAARLTQLDRVMEEGGPDRAARILASPVLDTLTARAMELRQQDTVWARSYDATHPRRAEIARELAEIDADRAREVDRIQEQRRSDLEIARLREASLQQSISTTEGKVMSISQNTLGLRQLEREAAAARQTYEALLARVTDTRTQKELQQPDAKLIERAVVPGAPSAPKVKLLVAMAVFAAGGLAASAALFGELTATTFRGTAELESETGLPVLAALPRQSWRNPRQGLAALRGDPYSPYAEGVRQLRTALLMRDGREGSHSVLLLSSAPGEGKTTLTLALAEMAVMAGKSVIVVDCDLRRSTIHKMFGWSMEHDFADFIQGQATLADAIHSPADTGFDVLCARGPRADAAEELSLSWLRPVMDELTRVYDLVLVDAPALLAVSDGLIVAQAVDTRLYVVAAGETPRDAVQRGLAQLADRRAPATELVLNKADPRHGPDAYAREYRHGA